VFLFLIAHKQQASSRHNVSCTQQLLVLVNSTQHAATVFVMYNTRLSWRTSERTTPIQWVTRCVTTLSSQHRRVSVCLCDQRQQ